MQSKNNKVASKSTDSKKTTKVVVTKPKQEEVEVVKTAIDIVKELPLSENKYFVEEEILVVDGEEKTIPIKINKKQIKKELLTYQAPRFLDRSSLQGLTDEEVYDRTKYGFVNNAHDVKGKTIPGIIFSNIFTFFNILFFAIAGVLIAFNSFSNLTFLFAVIPNLFIGIFQEIKAKKTIEKLSLLSSPVAIVIRNSEKREIPIKEIVLDDIIFYKSGNQICTDSIVTEGTVEVNESLITGESDAIEKKIGDLLYSGSFIVSGACLARADKVGKDNYIETLASNAKKYQKPKSELLGTLNAIIKVISVIIIPIGGFLFYSTYQQNGNILREAVISTSGGVIGMIPAGLFLLTSIALYAGVIRLSRRNKTLVQELYCIEMLARVNVLCLDKTGTITDGTMKVVDSIEVKNDTDYTIREIIGSMMSAFPESNPTSDALIKYYDKNKVLKPIDIISFSSKRKYSAVTFENEGTFILGAPEFVLTDTVQYDKVRAKVERFSSQGCRVLTLAHCATKIKDQTVPKTAKALALIVIQDHIREDAAETIAYFKQNGVDVKVISGDNPITVSEISQRVGVENATQYISLEGMTDDEIRSRAFDYTVFGRVTPSQKKVLVETFKAHKKTVAMTGDGVNDILALKEADCSIAMASGSDATKYVSHLVLMDSNFASMPKVVAEGRRVINNIQRTSTLFLTKTIFSVLLCIMYIFLTKHQYPFAPKDLFLIEIFINGFAATVLALLPNTEQVKGRFVTNIFKTAVPGALAIVFFNALLYVLDVFLFTPKGLVVLTEDSYRTICILISTFVCILVLFKVCKPFNTFTKLIFGAVIVGCLSVILFLNNTLGKIMGSETGGLIRISLEDLTNGGLTPLLLLIIFFLAAGGVVHVISYILKKMKLYK